MCIGNRNIERVAHDVDRPCRHGEVDVGVSAVDSQRLMGFDENQPFDEIGKMLLDAPARRPRSGRDVRPLGRNREFR